MADRGELHEATRAAAHFYQRQLLDTPDGWAVGHLRERGLEAVVSRECLWVGYAPDGWSRLVGHLRRSGFGDDAILECGLASPTGNGYLVDRFRDRIMFVARDIDLRPVGFVGRGRGNRLRYLNTPITEIYAKGQTLVGLDQRVHPGAVPVLVEGTMDAAAVNLLGGGFVGAACCGTAITWEQALILRRHSRSDVVVVALDGDVGGRSGAVRSLDVLSEVFPDVRYAALPDRQDPAALFAAGKEQLREVLTAARPLADFAIEVELERWSHVLDHISGQVNAVRAVAPLVTRLPAARIAGQIATLARAVHLDERIVSREVLAAVGVTPRRRPKRRRPRKRSSGVEAGADAPDISRTP